MFRNYWKIAVRSLQRNKSYATINFLGLTIGIAACLLLFMVIRYELSFDTFHARKDRTFRIVSSFDGPEGKQLVGAVPFPVAKTVRLTYPQLEAVVPTFYDWGQQIIVPGVNGEIRKKFKENVFYTEPSFFKTFNFKVLEGNTDKSLTELNSVLLSRSTADKYFGDWKTAVGQTLRLNNVTPLTVTGILEDAPANTDFPLSIVASFATLKGNKSVGNDQDWVTTNSGLNCFVVLPPGYSPAQFESSVSALVRKNKPAEYSKDGVALQPLSDLHYNSQLENYSGVSFSKDFIRALELIGVFLLVIACINFINLATAQAVNRAREVGVRKVLGSSRRQLLLRFMAETGLITLMAVVAAVLIAIPVLTPLNALLNIHLTFSPLDNPSVLFFLLSVLILVTLLSGFYPSLVLSGFNPITALKSKIAATSSRGVSLRRGLVVLQFVIAQVLITGVLVIVSQMNYFRNADLGFNRSAVVTVGFPDDTTSRNKLGTLKEQLLRQPGIEAVSYSFAAPSDNSSWGSDFRFNNSPKKTDFTANLRWADTGYFGLYHLSLVAGRVYRQTDTMNEYVINETCVKKLGMTDPQQALGKKIDFWDGQHVGYVVGVVKDFHVNSLRDPLDAVVMSCWKHLYYIANIKMRPARMKETLSGVEGLWNTTFPAYAFEYKFLDDTIAGFYKQENQLSFLYKVFAGIAIFISCLGLYGLISFMAVQRNKEIGVRKVLGASVHHIVLLLSKEFTVLIGIAFVIASPLAWYFMHRWLQQYSYRIRLGPGFFVVTILSSLVIAWLAVGWRSLRAALVNPAKSLRSE